MRNGERQLVEDEEPLISPRRVLSPSAQNGMGSAFRLPGDRALTALQINYAREVVENRKVLKDTSMAVVWPFMRYICCCFFRN